MNGKHYTEQDWILYHYGEAEDPAKMKRHLAECDACRAELDALTRIFQAVDGATAPDPRPGLSQRVMRRLEDEAEPRASSWLSWFRAPRLAYAAGIAVLLLAAFLIGHRQGRVDGQRLALAPEVRERLLLTAVTRHLASSERMLVELGNAVPSRNVDLRDQRRLADRLASTNRLYRQTADRNGRADLVTLLDDLERVLLDIANSPDELTPSEFRELWTAVERQGLLLKMRALQNRDRSIIKGSRRTS